MTSSIPKGGSALTREAFVSTGGAAHAAPVPLHNDKKAHLYARRPGGLSNIDFVKHDYVGDGSVHKPEQEAGGLLFRKL